MMRHTGTFIARTNAGAPVMLHIYTEFARVAAVGDHTIASVPERFDIKTAGGLPVNRLEKGNYQVVATGEVLTSDDPNAP